MQTIKCSNCDKNLICLIENKAGKLKKAKASCCYCGDYSFIFDFKMGSHVSGFGKEVLINHYAIQDNGIPELELTLEDIKQETIIVGLDSPKEGIWTFKTSKVQ